jgi:hypothetical protein
MATDYILFIHGVNTRDVREKPEYADMLFNRLQESAVDSRRKLEKIALYWGDVNSEAENNLRTTLKTSPVWQQMKFKGFRENQILQFVGDAALYISRYIGSKVVRELKKQALEGLKNAQPDDRLHLVTHSWGTFILFDVLFASRWNEPETPGHDDVMAIRDVIFGISGNDPNPLQGIQVASIHTMGSPISIFSLTDAKPGKDDSDSPSSHDITPNLQKLLAYFHQAHQERKLPWKNYIHPADPIAYPLKELIVSLVDGESEYLDIQDFITHEASLLDFITHPFDETILALMHGGAAHGSYWDSDKVVQEISSCLHQKVASVR